MHEVPILPFESPASWEAWLVEYAADETGIWLKLYKKASGWKSITYAEALEVALCFGWIDGQKKSFDEHAYLQRFTQRRKRSGWSKVNTGIAERLIAEGKMRPRGLAEIEQAKADGRWVSAYDSAKTATIPTDFEAALQAVPAAAEFFAGLKQANRYAMLYRLQTAKRQETRERKIREFVQMLAEGRAIHQI